MKASEDIKSVTYLKTKAAHLLEEINTNQRPIIITQNGQARAVIQDPISYDEMKMAIGLMKLIAQGEEDIREGKFFSQDRVFERLNKQLTIKRVHSVKKKKI